MNFILIDRLKKIIQQRTELAMNSSIANDFLYKKWNYFIIWHEFRWYTMVFMSGLLQKSIQKRSIQKSYYYPTNSSYTGCLEPEIIAIDAEVGRWAAGIVDRMRTAGNEISGMISSMNSPWGGLGKAWVRRSTGMTRSCRIVVVLGRWRGSRTFLHTPVGAQTRDWN